MIDNEATEQVGDLSRLVNVLSRALPLLERIAVALERSPGLPSASTTGRKVRGEVDLRRAIEQGEWTQARTVADDLAREFPDDPEVTALVGDLERTRRSAAEDLQSRIEAARQANDPDGALNFRDELARVLDGADLAEVDRAMIKWLLVLIQRRLRTGTVRPDVVALASRVASSFGGTTEGASLRASLPTLRRSAGLCPTCSEPYAGVGDACPKCLAAARPSPTPAYPPGEPDSPELDELEVDLELIVEPIDLNNERFWQDP